MGVAVNATPGSFYPRQGDPISIVLNIRLGGPRGWSGLVGKFAPTGVRTPDFPVRSKFAVPIMLSRPSIVKILFSLVNFNNK